MATAGNVPTPRPSAPAAIETEGAATLTSGFPDPSRLKAMREHLVRARPASGNEALQVLRRAFPDTPLAERVHAAGEIASTLY